MAGPRGSGKGRDVVVRVIVPKGTLNRHSVSHEPSYSHVAYSHVEGKCLVCAQAFSGEVKKCPTCETPHHTECWQYNHGCAVYGCNKIHHISQAAKIAESRHVDYEIILDEVRPPVQNTNSLASTGYIAWIGFWFIMTIFQPYIGQIKAWLILKGVCPF